MPFPSDLQAKIDAFRSGGSDSPEVASLRAKLAARDGKPGYADSVKAIKARIAELTEAAGADQETTS